MSKILTPEFFEQVDRDAEYNSGGYIPNITAIQIARPLEALAKSGVMLQRMGRHAFDGYQFVQNGLHPHAIDSEIEELGGAKAYIDRSGFGFDLTEAIDVGRIAIPTRAIEEEAVSEWALSLCQDPVVSVSNANRSFLYPRPGETFKYIGRTVICLAGDDPVAQDFVAVTDESGKTLGRLGRPIEVHSQYNTATITKVS